MAAVHDVHGGQERHPLRRRPGELLRTPLGRARLAEDVGAPHGDLVRADHHLAGVPGRHGLGLQPREAQCQRIGHCSAGRLIRKVLLFRGDRLLFQ